MFDQTFVNTHAQTRRPWTVALSLSLQTGLVGLIVLLPMLHPELLKPKTLEMPIYLPVRPTPPQPVVIPESRTIATRPVFAGPPRLSVPTKVPDFSARMIADEAPSVAFTNAISGGPYVGIPGIADGLPPHAEPIPEVKAPPVAVKPAPPPGPVHVSLGVQSAKLTFGPKPAYPPLAKAARVQGTVKLAAVIASNGVIRDLRVVSGPPLLVKAAIDAVGQWRYQPTLLSGNAVEVITEIDVNFTLSQ